MPSLLEEGYIASAQRRGFFVEAVEIPEPTPAPLPPRREGEEEAAPLADLTGNGTGQFPFSVWARLQREVILDYGKALLSPMDPRGAPALRQAIARNLSDFRGLRVDPENILVGAGTDFLYNLLMQLLGQDKVYGVEDPGYGKIRKIYAAGGVRCRPIPMDDQGLRIGDIGTAQVLHISPGHHFPTGLITPQKRRREMLDWAKKTGGFIIEDDYDTEFRFRGHPIPPMQTLDPERVDLYEHLLQDPVPLHPHQLHGAAPCPHGPVPPGAGLLRLHRGQLRAIHPGQISGPGVL